MGKQETRALANGLTVRELIEQLQEMDQDKKVVFSYPSGDYWKTVLAAPVGNLEEGFVEYSDYHRKLKVDEGDDMTQPEDLEETVIILS